MVARPPSSALPTPVQMSRLRPENDGVLPFLASLVIAVSLSAIANSQLVEGAGRLPVRNACTGSAVLKHSPIPLLSEIKGHRIPQCRSMARKNLYGSEGLRDPRLSRHVTHHVQVKEEKTMRALEVFTRWFSIKATTIKPNFMGTATIATCINRYSSRTPMPASI